jgi:transposase
MISIDKYASIRWHRNNGYSIRATVRMTGISRVTVKKYWNGKATPADRTNYPPSVDSDRKKAVMKEILDYLAENASLQAKKQMITARRIHEHVSAKLCVGESTIRRYVRELGLKRPEAFMPLSFEPGEVMQVDWTEAKVIIKGTMHKMPIFCAVLPFSYNIFCMILPDMAMPSFIEGHILAFEHFGGVTRRVFYDNLKTAVFAGHGKKAVKQESFRRLIEAHYGFEAAFMNINSGNEKGAVENLCGTVKRIALTPIPRAESLEKVQECLLSRCASYLQTHRIKGRPRPVLDMFLEESGKLMPLPAKSLEGFEAAEAKVGTDMTFRHETNRYSVPESLVGETVALKIFPYRIEAWHGRSLAASHARIVGKHKASYVPEHYLPLIERKPRSAENAAPLKEGAMPPELALFREKCQAPDKLSQIADILRMGPETDPGLLMRAVDYANCMPEPRIGHVRAYLAMAGGGDGCGGTPATEEAEAEEPSLDEYDALLGPE